MMTVNKDNKVLGPEGNNCTSFLAVSIVNSSAFNLSPSRLKRDDKSCKLIAAPAYRGGPGGFFAFSLPLIVLKGGL